MKKIKLPLTYITLTVISALAALNYKIFVFPNSFAPAGIDGICTMIQYLTKTSMGYLSLIVNIPLVIAGMFIVKRDFMIKTAVYTITFSIFTVILSYIDLSSFLYYTDTGTSIVLAPIAAGVIRGLLYAVTLKLGGSGGGIDIIAAIVKRYRPHHNLMNIIFGLNVIVALGAYFVYGFKVEPVICSIIYSFVTSEVSKNIESTGKESLRFEIITEESERLCTDMRELLGINATIIDAEGAFTGSRKKMVICVTKKEVVPKLEKLILDYPDTVVFESTIVASNSPLIIRKN